MKVKIILDADFGFSHSGSVYTMDEMEYEMSQELYDYLKSIDKDSVYSSQVEAAINAGKTELKELHEKATDAFYNMVEHYWLYDGDNECELEAICGSLEEDVESGLYTLPMTMEEFIEAWESGKINTEDSVYSYEAKDLWIKLEKRPEEEWLDEFYETNYETHMQNLYRAWVFEHDHPFIADRVGCDLEACRDTDLNYRIDL